MEGGKEREERDERQGETEQLGGLNSSLFLANSVRLKEYSKLLGGCNLGNLPVITAQQKIFFQLRLCFSPTEA